MLNYLETDKVSTVSLYDTYNDVKSLTYEAIEYVNNEEDLNNIKQGLEEVDNYFHLLFMNDSDRKKHIELTGLGYGLEDLDSAVATIKKAAISVIKFILNILDRSIKFVTSFFNKGMNLTEKFFIARILQQRSNLERALDNKNMNKNAPLDLKENIVKKILKRKDLFLLEAMDNKGEVNPTLITNYVRSTLTLFTDNIVMYDNTGDSLANMVKSMKESTVTSESFIGFVSEKNKDLITSLNPIKQAYNRNRLLNRVVEIGLSRNKKDGFDISIIPLPRAGSNENKMGYVAIGVRKPQDVAKLKFEDVKSIDDLLFGKEDFIDYKDLHINIDKLESMKVKSASFSEIDTIVEIYKEASEKIKKKLNTDKITKKLEKIKKQMTVINGNEFSSKVSNLKLFYLNTSLKVATTIMESSRQLYTSGYCDTIKDYIMGHSV